MNTTDTNRIEYKRQLTDDLEKEAIAFLNYHEPVLSISESTRPGSRSLIPI